MSMFSWAFKSNAELSDSEIQEIFPLALQSDLFIRSDILNTYTKILTDTMERTHGLDEKQEPLLWDSCVQSEANHGLISMLALAMTRKLELFLVYLPSVQLLRKATFDEQEKIREDYKKSGESKTGVYISFQRYHRTDMLEIYSSFEYCVLASLNKTLNASKALQIKVSDLRSSVSLADSGVAKDQARSIAKALKNGNDVLLDVKDMIETAKLDTSPAQKSIDFMDAKRAYILGLPLSYINSEQTPGIGSTGEADMRAVERGLKQYFNSVLRPVLKAVFGADTEFRSQDFREMATALEAAKTFDLVSNETISSQAKQEIIARLFDLDPEEEQKNLEADAKQAELDKKNNPPPTFPIVPKQPGGFAPASNGANPPAPNGATA
jgi:hypothetical protein